MDPTCFRAERDSGVRLAHPLTLPREGLLWRIQDAVEHHAAVLVCGPPGCGKTALVCLLFQAFTLANRPFVLCSLSGLAGTEVHLLEQACLDQIKYTFSQCVQATSLEEVPILGVQPLSMIDDAYLSEGLIESVVKAGFNVLAFAFYNIDVTWATPVEFRTKVRSPQMALMLRVSL